MWCIILPILVGLISAILGYLLGRLRGGNINVNNQNNVGGTINADLEALKLKNTKLQAELEACKGLTSTSVSLADFDALKLKNAQLEADISGLNTKLSSINLEATRSGIGTFLAFNADSAKEIFGKVVKENDLKLVEGIGPKIEELFHAAGIKTWAALASATYDTCKQILDNAGDAYRMHNPTTWPEQAKMAVEGRFEELKQWQDQLDGGK